MHGLGIMEACKLVSKKILGYFVFSRREQRLGFGANLCRLISNPLKIKSDGIKINEIWWERRPVGF